MLSQKEWENRNHLTSVGHEAVISYQFGKVPYILTENLFARLATKDTKRNRPVVQSYIDFLRNRAPEGTPI